LAKRLLLTRARPQAEAFASDVRNQTGLTPFIAPMQEMRDLPVEIDLAGITALAFTSKNGVEAFARKSPLRLPAYCVGKATATRAQALGFEARSTLGNVESLKEILPDSGVLHLHGRHVAGLLGVPHLAIYEQVALPLSQEATARLSAGEIAAVALFSPRSSRLLMDIWQPDWPKEPVFYALSEAVAAPLRALGQPRICDTPDAASMLRLLSADYPA